MRKLILIFALSACAFAQTNINVNNIKATGTVRFIGPFVPTDVNTTTLEVSGLSTLSGGVSDGKVIRDCRQDGVVADGVTNDATALNLCLANAFANGQQVQLPSGKIHVTSAINDTNKPGLIISGVAGNQDYSTLTATQDYGTVPTQIMCDTGVVCWDVTGSKLQKINNLSLRIANSYATPSTFAMLFGRDNVATNGSASGNGTYCFSSGIHLKGVYIFADSLPAATALGRIGVYNLNAETFTWEDGGIIADLPLWFSQTNDVGVASAFQTLQTGCAASMSEIKILGSNGFQAWTQPAVELRNVLNFESSATTEYLNGLIGTNHSACMRVNAPLTVADFGGQCEQFDSVASIAATTDRLKLHVLSVQPTAGLISLGGVTITGSTFDIRQQNGSAQPLINAASSASTCKGCFINEASLSGTGAAGSNLTLTESIVFAPGLTDTNVNTFASGSKYWLFDDTGNSFFGPISTNDQITSTLATGTAPFVVASTTNVPNLNASSLGGATFAAPGAIGGTTPAPGTFTTATITTQLALVHGSLKSTATFAGAVGCTTGAAVGATCTSGALTWSNTLVDTSYFPECTFDGATTNVPVIQSVTKTSATQFTITIAALTAAAATGSVTCLAYHT